MTNHTETFAEWSDAPPTKQGWYWHWNGDHDSAPLPTSVLYSGTSGKCFVSSGQLGLDTAIDCDEYGGFWAPLPRPSTYDAPIEELKKALPVVIYFENEADRQEFIDAVQQVKPNMRPVKI